MLKSILVGKGIQPTLSKPSKGSCPDINKNHVEKNLCQ
jgi:hypothetical protein